MPKLTINGVDLYYEITGEGEALVFIHGAFVDARIWEPQWKHFSTKYRVLRYDLRGHGRSGASDLQHYTMATFADDLVALLDALKIEKAILCGLSWGGGIAQVFAVNKPHRLQALVLAGATASMSVSLGEKLLRYVLFPRWAMRLTIRMLSVERFERFSEWLAGVTLGRDWISRDEDTFTYLRECMLQIDQSEYLKIWDAIYGFNLQRLEKIRCPTLVLHGERDTKMVSRHANEILRLVPGAERCVLPAAYHAMTLEEPQAFNEIVEQYLQRHIELDDQPPSFASLNR